jgi:LysR family glycine cleavage system transcriptional activator
MECVRRLPSLSAIRVFEAAARRSSFAQAADELSLTATAVSHQIRALEQSLGRPLFRRRPTALTRDGEILYASARRALDELGAGWGALRNPTGSLVVSATRAFAGAWLVPRLAIIERELGFTLEVEATEVPSDLSAGDADLVLRLRRSAPRGFRSLALVTERFLAVASPKRTPPLAVTGDLAAHQLIHCRWAVPRLELPTWPSYLESIAANDPTARSVDPTSGLKVGEEAQALAAAIAGQGVALLGQTVVHDALRAGSLVQVLPHSVPGVTLYAVWPERHPRVDEIERLAEWLSAQLRTA